MPDKIKKIRARQILDSRKNPTVEVEMETEKGIFKSSVPSGASTGQNEAVEIRDADGKGVKNAISNIEKTIGSEIIGLDSLDQRGIDRIMIDLDGTSNKSNLGANAVLPVSMCVCRAGAAASDLPLYRYISGLAGTGSSSNLARPVFNILNGGAHARNNLDIQEFLIIPNENSFSANLSAGIEIYNDLKKELEKALGRKAIELGDEGGFMPMILKTIDALDFIKNASRKHVRTKFGLDCAATQFFKKGKYNLEGKDYSKKELADLYKKLIAKYNIIYLEDPFSENDWQSWKDFFAQLEKPDDSTVIGDDLTATNKEILEKAVKERCLNGVIIKINQVGTISETLETVKLAKEKNIKIAVSHRSGETMDDFIADLAVGIGADFIKSGAPFPKERMAKYNRLLKIEKELLN
ncbi:MAG: phosphopyruvate hydratase [Candidatus Nealsonbacteria bacterium]|nr:phosphopyruvate hydratase [Candidatus Nealsonbacteria bacterium]